MSENIIRTVKIDNVVEECKGVKTISFNMKKGNTHYIKPKSGQFVMIWVPGVDEVPMSISGCDEDGNWSITVKNVGECTYAIHKLKIGENIGVRGPLGNHFKYTDTSIADQEEPPTVILVGGGIGMAPMKFLAEELKGKKRVLLINAAKTKEEIVYMKNGSHFCTDDGSFGEKGFATKTLEELIIDHFDHGVLDIYVYACGPEKMLHKTFEICDKHEILMQASLERVMRCGCGLCGLCAIDPTGLLVCKDGPVFHTADLRNMLDFGNKQRDFTGKKKPI